MSIERKAPDAKTRPREEGERKGYDSARLLGQGEDKRRQEWHSARKQCWQWGNKNTHKAELQTSTRMSQATKKKDNQRFLYISFTAHNILLIIPSCNQRTFNPTLTFIKQSYI